MKHLVNTIIILWGRGIKKHAVAASFRNAINRIRGTTIRIYAYIGVYTCRGAVHDEEYHTSRYKSPMLFSGTKPPIVLAAIQCKPMQEYLPRLWLGRTDRWPFFMSSSLNLCYPTPDHPWYKVCCHMLDRSSLVVGRSI